MPAPSHRRGGPATHYPGKDRNHSTTVCLTPEGRKILEEDAARLDRSKADHIEHLLRREHDRLQRSPSAAAAK